MLAFDDIDETIDNVGMPGGYVVVFMDIVGEVVEMRLPGFDYEFPVAFPYTDLIRFIEFPVKERMDGLSGLIHKRRIEGDAVKAVVGHVGVGISAGKVGNAGETCHCRHYVVESDLQVRCAAGSYCAGPVGNERHAYASLMDLAFESAQLAVATEKCGVGTAFFMRSVVAGEDDEGVMPIVLESGKIVITISNTDLKAVGTPLNTALYDFIAKKNAMEESIGELERKETRMVMDGADLEEVHEQLLAEGDSLMKAMNQYVKTFISDNYENVLGPNVFIMLCSSLPYPIMTPQIDDIIKDAPYSFKSNKMVREFLTKAKENMQLIEEHQRMQQNVGSKK